MVNDIKFSRGEQKLLDYFDGRIGENVPIDELADHFYAERVRPANPRGSVAALMRVLILKCKAAGVRSPLRISNIGRGSVAVYRLGKGKG